MQDPNTLLKKAVDSIVHSINAEKLPAHAAVVKTAREMDLNVHFIKRACEVINVALTYEHFRKNADARDKDFPIVDAQKVSAEVFDEKPVTLNQKKSAWFEGAAVEEEVPNFRKARHGKEFQDMLGKLGTLQEEPRGMSERGLCEKAGYARQSLERTLEDCRTQVHGAMRGVDQGFATLVNHWSKEAAARTSFAEFETQILAKHGEWALPYVELIYKTANISEDRGELDAKLIAFDDCREVTMFEQFIKSAEELREAVARTAEAATLLAEVDNEKTAAYTQRMVDCVREEDTEVSCGEPLLVATVQKVAEHDEEEVDPVVACANAKVAAEEKEKEKQAIGTSFPKTLFDSFVEQYKQEASPESGRNGALGNLDRKLLVQNLMVSDPILRTYEPKKVADAYEQFMRLAPELSTEKEIVRSHLRQMVASQAMTAFDGAQLMDANTKLLKQKQMERVGDKAVIKEEK